MNESLKIHPHHLDTRRAAPGSAVIGDRDGGKDVNDGSGVFGRPVQ
jgi:hypothetical protein